VENNQHDEKVTTEEGSCAAVSDSRLAGFELSYVNIMHEHIIHYPKAKVRLKYLWRQSSPSFYLTELLVDRLQLPTLESVCVTSSSSCAGWCLILLEASC
jgi:hypothetical protein